MPHVAHVYMLAATFPHSDKMELTFIKSPKSDDSVAKRIATYEDKQGGYKRMTISVGTVPGRALLRFSLKSVGSLALLSTQSTNN